jgi:dihydrofolate reductase
VRKVVVSQFVSLDGVVEDPSSWTFQFSGEEQQKYKLDELAAADTLLLGRVTYEEFAAAWPKMMEQYEGPGRAELGEYADMMNGYPKFVVSTTLREAEWNNSTVITGNVADEVSRLKQQPGKDILVFGSTELVNALVRHGLVDEFRLMVFPIVLGGGKRLFEDAGEQRALSLVDTKTFNTDVVVLTYEPAQS